MKALQIVTALVLFFPTLSFAQRPALSWQDRVWIEHQMYNYQARENWNRQQAARAEFAGALAGGIISGLSSMAAAEENRKNMQSLYLKLEAMQREAAEKPFRMIWAVRFRSSMRQQAQPEWQINHWLRASGVEPAEVDAWAELLAALPPPPTAVPPPAPAPAPAKVQKYDEDRDARRRLAEDLYTRIAEPNLSSTDRAKRIRALGFDPATLKPLEDTSSSLASK